ncbi:TPA: hypothetical protein RZI82_000990 [Campylobacter coli]|nr:hypothetical protein [Campylobacter coli]
MKKYKKITSRGKRFLRHYDRRSTNEKYKKFSRCNIIKKRYISKLPPKNPFTVPKHNIDIRGNIVFPRNINKINQKIKDMQMHAGLYKICVNHRHLDEIDNTSILILTVLINEAMCNIKKFQKNKKLSPKKEIDERLSAIGYWEALCVNHISNNSNLDYLKIASHCGKEIDNGLHIKIVNFVLEKTELSMKYKDIFMDAVFEAMANAKEHAYDDSKDKKIWLMGAYNEKTKETEIIFYDIGIGIFQSLEYSETKFAKYLNKFANMFGKKKALERLCTTNLSKYKKNKRRGLGMMVYKKLIDSLSAERNAILELYSDSLRYSTNKGTHAIQGNIKGTLVRWIIGEKK